MPHPDTVGRNCRGRHWGLYEADHPEPLHDCSVLRLRTLVFPDLDLYLLHEGHLEATQLFTFLKVF